MAAKHGLQINDKQTENRSESNGKKNVRPKAKR